MSAPTASAPSNRRALLAWCVYDWANSAIPTLIVTFVFATYFTTAVAPDERTGTALWLYAQFAMAIVIVVFAPVAGAIADAAGRRKPWLAACTIVCVIAAGLLWYVRPEASSVWFALAVSSVAIIAFEMGATFYNAMLPDLAPHGEIGRWSGWAWGLGYFGGLSCLVIALFAFVNAESPLFGLDKSSAEHVRIVGPLAAVWFGIFSIPLFLLTPDRPSQKLGVCQAIAQGLRQLAETIRNVRRHALIARFLFAKMVYIDGLNTIFAVGGIYAATVFGMPLSEVIMFGILLNVTAGLGAASFALLDDWFGPKPVIQVSLAAMMAIGVPLLVVTDVTWFWILGAGLGIFFGPVQAGSRSTMARLAPPDLRTEMFGLYSLAGKATAFAGPLVFGVLVDLTGSQRVGMASTLVFLLAGFILLWPLKLPR